MNGRTTEEQADMGCGGRHLCRHLPPQDADIVVCVEGDAAASLAQHLTALCFFQGPKFY